MPLAARPLHVLEQNLADARLALKLLPQCAQLALFIVLLQ
jgi:hypothetical protein